MAERVAPRGIGIVFRAGIEKESFIWTVAASM